MIREQSNNWRATSPASSRLIDPRLFVLALFLLSATVVLFGTRVSTTTAAAQATAQTAAAQQPRRTPARRRAAAPRRPGVDYTKYNHMSVEGHYKDCASCHVTKTPGLDGKPPIPPVVNKDRLGPMTLTKPDLREYPDHHACTDCHRQQFFRGPFRGTAPTICADCHASVTPRNGARLPFPKPPQAQSSQFEDIFPHGRHKKSATALPMFAREMKVEKVKQQDTCYYCHKLDKTEYKPPAGAAKDAFVPKPGTFMLTPTSHASCFSCHWQEKDDLRSQSPVANDCFGCHYNKTIEEKMKAAPTPAATPAKPAATPKTAPTPKPKPAGDLAHASFMQADWTLSVSFVPALSLEQQQKWPERLSPKFRHELDPNPKADPHQYRPTKNEKGEQIEPVKITCLSCHLKVKDSESLKDLRLKANKVQLPTCSTSQCHTALTKGSRTWGLSVYNELQERKNDPKFDCATCHLPPISNDPNRPIPCSHYVVVYQTAKDENKPKAMEAIKALTPQPRCSDVVK